MGQSFSSCCKKEEILVQSTVNEAQKTPLSTMNTSMTQEPIPPKLEKKEFKIQSSHFVRRRSCAFSDVYEALEDVGEGSYGKIIKVRHLFSNELRVVKVVNKNVIHKGVSENDVINEINILKSMDHPNIIKVFEFFSDENNIYIVKEYFNEGDLFNNLMKLDMNESLICSIMRQILSAVSYLHSKKVLHGDLKLENILIETQPINDSYVDIKLTDFGCSKIFYNRVCRKFIGTTYYLAPEILQSEYNEKCDIWSAGVILYILLSGRLPFEGSCEKEIIEKIRSKSSISYDLEEFSHFSKEAISVLKMMLIYDYNDRPSASEILKHHWFKSFLDDKGLIQKEELRKTLNFLRNYHSRTRFHQAVISFLTHNVEKNEEVKKLALIFKLLDKDSDGKISIFDLKKGLEENFKNITFLEVENIIKNITYNDECFIAYEEFLSATLDKNLLFTEQKLKEAFDLFDVNKEGIIHANEIKKVLSREQEVSDEIMAEILSEIQVKMDEDIEYEAFKKLMLEVINENNWKESCF
jgi:calcium-dependent protein kinase